MSEERRLSALERASHALAMIEHRWQRGEGLEGERAMELIGQIHELTGTMAVEMTKVRATFITRAARRRDEEEEKAREAVQDQAQVLTLIDVLDDEDLDPTPEELKLARMLRECADDEAAAICLHKELMAEGLRVLRAMIAFIWHGRPDEKTMIKRTVAITRRYQRETLGGVTLTEAARLHGDGSRCAGQSAREHRIHDRQFERIGIRAPGAADGGLKTAATREKNRLAAMGNSNRKGKGANKNKQTTTTRL